MIEEFKLAEEIEKKAKDTYLNIWLTLRRTFNLLFEKVDLFERVVGHTWRHRYSAGVFFTWQLHIISEKEF